LVRERKVPLRIPAIRGVGWGSPFCGDFNLRLPQSSGACRQDALLGPQSTGGMSGPAAHGSAIKVNAMPGGNKVTAPGRQMPEAPITKAFLAFWGPQSPKAPPAQRIPGQMTQSAVAPRRTSSRGPFVVGSGGGDPWVNP